MSIDLKGNTNYVAFHDLEQGLVVPRTNLSAVDMNVGNGLEVQGDTINIREADAIQIVNGTQTNTVITSEALRRAIMMGSTSALDMKKQSMSPIGGTATLSFNEYGITIDGTSNASISGMAVDGPIAGLSERTGKWLLVFDVYIPVNASVTGFSCTGDTGIIFEAITGYTLNVTEQGSWVRCAALIDTTAAVYTGGLNFTLTVSGNIEYAFSLGNIRIQYVNGLLDNEVQYLVLSGKINTTVEGETVVVDGNNAYLFIPGEGIEITDSTISTAIEKADTKAVLNGDPDVFVSTKGLASALTAGQAVNVTSAPDGVTGDYLGSFTVTGSSLGFAAFPKYAKNLNYLFIATIVPTTTGTVTPSANCKWLDTGDRAARSIAAGDTVKLAVTFTSNADTCPASLALSGTGTVTVSYCRQYEVTACSAEAVNYIASLNNPDAFADYYLVKSDMVQPWTYIIDMGTSPAVTVAAGLSYKLNASTGTHTLTVDTCPVGYDGRDAIIRITLGGTGVVQAVAPLQLGDALVPYAINNCVVRFRDGEAVLLVEDTLAGYVVTVTSGTDSGSLAYGLAATGVPYIAFSTGTDDSVVDMGDAVTANEEVTVVGNGYTNTTITGNITCTNKTTVANLGLQDVTVTGGTLTLGDAYIPSGSTVAVSGGSLATERVTGAGSESVIDLGGSSLVPTNAVANGIKFVNISSGGVMTANGYSLAFTSCFFTNAQATSTGDVFFLHGATQVFFNSCTFSGNASTPVYLYGNSTLSNGSLRATFKDCKLLDSSAVAIRDKSAQVCLAGSNVIPGNVFGVAPLSGTVLISSGAVVDLTGNTNATPINPGGAIIASGNNTFIYGPSSATTTAYITGASFTQISSGTKLTFGCLGNITVKSGVWSASNAVFSRGSGAGDIIVVSGGNVNLTNISASYTSYNYIGIYGGTITLNGCATDGGSPIQFRGSGGVLVLSGSNFIGRGISHLTGSSGGSMIIADNATINESGGFLAIDPGLGITFGANVTIINSAGTSSPLNGGSSGTCSKINANGTIA